MKRNMLKEFVIFASVAFALAQVGSKTQCRHDDECGVNECCYYHEGPMIVSKRQSLLSVISHQGGWCEQYQVLGSRCNPFDKLNGHCSCAPGLTCKRFPYTTPASTIAKRRLLPGDYLCAPVE